MTGDTPRKATACDHLWEVLAQALPQPVAIQAALATNALLGIDPVTAHARQGRWQAR